MQLFSYKSSSYHESAHVNYIVNTSGTVLLQTILVKYFFFCHLYLLFYYILAYTLNNLTNYILKYDQIIQLW